MILALLYSLFGLAGPAPSSRACDVEPVILQAAEIAVRGLPRTQPVWPHEWPDPGPFAFYPFGGGTLLISDLPPRGNLREVEGVPEALRGRAFVDPAATPFVHLPGARPRYPIGGHDVMVVSVLCEYGAVEDPVLATLIFLFQASFHWVYQVERFAPTEGSGWAALEEPEFPDTVAVAGEAFRASLTAERRALRTALRAGAREDALTALREYRALRSARLLAAPAGTARYEEHLERKEGVADFAGYEAALRVAGEPETRLLELLSIDLTSPMSEGPVPNAWADYHHWHLAAGGGAKAGLLHHLECEGWREGVVAGATLDALLDACVGGEGVGP